MSHPWHPVLFVLPPPSHFSIVLFIHQLSWVLATFIAFIPFLSAIGFVAARGLVSPREDERPGSGKGRTGAPSGNLPEEGGCPSLRFPLK